MTAPDAPTPAAPTAPRLEWLWVTAVSALCTAALGYPALTGQLLLNVRSDQFKAGYAFREFATEYFRANGAIPQWNPYLFGGMPFVDAMHGDTFYPTALLRILIGAAPGMTWGLIIHVFLAGVFAYLFFRTLRLSFIAALAGSVAYQMGGNVAGLVSPGHDGKLFLCALLPLALYFVARGVRDSQSWAWGPLAIVIGLGVLSPHPQLLQYMLLLTGAFALYLALGWASDSPVDRRRSLPQLGMALGSVAVGMVIGAIQYWPVKQYEPWSPRAGGAGWEHAISYSMPTEETVNFVLPQFSGILDQYWGSNGIHLHSEYLGITTVLLAGLAFGAWGKKSEKRLVTFWAVTLVITLLWALGGNTPFYRIIYAIVPGTKYFRAPSTMLFIVSFATAALAAFGAERLVRGENKRRYLIGAALATLFVTLLGLTGALTSVGSAVALEQRLDAVLANDGAVRLGAVRMFGFGALLLACAWMMMTRRLSRDLAGVLLVGIVAGDIWSVVKQYWIFSPGANELFASNAAIAYLQKQPAPFRVINVPLGDNPGRDQILNGMNYDGLMVHRIPSAVGYHGNQIGKYDILAGAPDYQQIGNPNFWRLANVRYFLSNVADLPFSAKRVLGPVKTASGNDIYLHETPAVTSYAWVTPAMVKAPEDAAVATVLDPRFDVRSAAIFDTSAQINAVALTTVPAPLALNARVTAYAPGSATIELDGPAPAGSALMVSENYYPGWTASVDGQPAALGRAAVSLIGIALPTGGRKVQLNFINKPYETGKRVTFGAIALAAVMWLAGLAAARRRPAIA